MQSTVVRRDPSPTGMNGSSPRACLAFSALACAQSAAAWFRHFGSRLKTHSEAPAKVSPEPAASPATPDLDRGQLGVRHASH